MIVLGIALILIAVLLHTPPIVLDLGILLTIVGVLLEIFGGGTGLSLRGRFRR